MRVLSQVILNHQAPREFKSLQHMNEKAAHGGEQELGPSAGVEASVAVSDLH